MIELDQLSKTYTQKDGTQVKAVDAVSLKVAEGEICVFLGPSGCGKTTTLKMINRLINPTSGRVLLNGQDTSGIDEVELRRHIVQIRSHRHPLEAHPCPPVTLERRFSIPRSRLMYDIQLWKGVEQAMHDLRHQLVEHARPLARAEDQQPLPSAERLFLDREELRAHRRPRNARPVEIAARLLEVHRRRLAVARRRARVIAT